MLKRILFGKVTENTLYAFIYVVLCVHLANCHSMVSAWAMLFVWVAVGDYVVEQLQKVYLYFKGEK